MVKKLGALTATLLVLAMTLSCTGENKSGIQNQNIFQYHLGGEPTKLNPITGTDLYNSRVSAFVLDRLLERDIDTLEWMPVLAESYEIGKDQKTFTFKLREGLKFHDGHPLTAEDVKFSVDVVFMDEYGAFRLRPYYESIESIEVVDPLTVVFKTRDRYFKNMEVISGLQIIPKHIYGDVEKGKNLNNTMIGSGPYKVKKYERGQMIVVERNEEWVGRNIDHLARKYNFEEIIFKFPKEDAVSLQMLRRGALDYLLLSAEQFVDQTGGPDWEGRINKYQVENKAPKGTSFVGWNFKKPIFQSRKVRLALYHLMNREVMNEKFAFGKNLLATGPWYNANPSADPAVKPVLFDLDAAKRLLTEDGWADNDKDGILEKSVNGNTQKLEFTLMYSNKDTEKYWVLYQEDLKKAGVNAKLQLVEWNSFIEKLDTHDFDAAALSWSGVIFPDPKQVWHSTSNAEGGSNFISYNNAEVDKLIDQARLEMDDSKRQTMMRKVFRLIAEDVPYAFLFNARYQFYATTPRVEVGQETRVYDLGIENWKLNVPQAVEP